MMGKTKKQNPDKFVLVRRVADQPEPLDERTKVDLCAECKREIWVSNGVRLSIEQKLYPERFICEHCAMRHISGKVSVYVSPEIMVMLATERARGNGIGG